MSEQHPSHSLAEAVSALIDNQASELELQRILKVSEQDERVKSTWSRYQMVGAALRGEQFVTASPDFAARLSAAIAAEDSFSSQTVVPKAQEGWWYQLGRVALVASVAGGMILSVQQFNTVGSVGSGASAQMASNALPVTTPSTTTNIALPSGINAPAINTRTVAAQAGYEMRPQETRRVMFQPRQANAPISDEEVTRYVNQMIQAHSDNAAMNSGQGVLPYARVIMTDEE